MPDLRPLVLSGQRRDHRRVGRYAHLARPDYRVPDRAWLSRPRLSGDAQPARSVRAEKLCDRRRTAGGARSRRRRGAGGLCRADARGMRQERRARRGHHQLRLCRGARRGGAGARRGIAPSHRALRHHRLRPQFRRHRQPAEAAGRDLQPGVPRPQAEPLPDKQQKPGDRGQLSERRIDLRVFEPRPAPAVALYLPGQRRQPDLPRSA